VGAYREQVVLDLQLVSQSALTRSHLTKVLLDVQELLAGLHTLLFGLQQDGGHTVEPLLKLANTVT
jgi:hypothetical protein